MESNFISEKDFLQEMESQWEGFGNTISDKLIDAWRIILSSFNNQLSGVKGLHVCDSVCGSGKTLAVEVASSLLSRDWEDVGTLVVVRLKDQCVDVSQRINEISHRLYGRSVAQPLFSGTHDGVHGELSNKEIHDAQVLVITHSRYLSGISGKGKSVFSSWRGGHRKFRVVDESLDLVERFHLTRGEVIELQSFLAMRKDFYTQFTEEYGDYYKFLNDIDRYLAINITEQQRYDHPFFDVVKDNSVGGDELYFSKLIPLINKSHPSDYVKKATSWKENQFEVQKESAEETILVLDRIIRRSIYHTLEDGNSTYSTGEIILPSQFESLCVLDATSNVDEVYKLFREKEQCHPYHVDRTVRTFRNCTIHIRPENSGLGLGITKKQAIPRTKQITSWADNEFSPTDKVLFAGHKVIVETILKHLGENPPGYQYDGCWWNAIDGKNTWKEFNKLVILSHNYLPQNYGPVTAIGFSDINPGVTENNINIADSSMAVKLIQLIARIQVRKVINKEGDCAMSDVYMLLPSRFDIHPDVEDEMNFKSILDSKGQYLIHEVEQSMNEVSIEKWTSFTGFSSKRKKSDKVSVQDKFELWVGGMKVGDTWDKTEFDSLVTPKESKYLTVALSKGESPASKFLRSMNITRISTRGRNGKTIFTRN